MKPEPALECKAIIFLSKKYTLKLYIAFKIDYSCCFS